MKTISFRKTAERDLLSIIDHYNNVAPEALPNILSDIYRATNQLAFFPYSGMEVPASRFGLRRIVSRQYHFKIIHHVTPDTVNIIGIFRYQNRES